MKIRLPIRGKKGQIHTLEAIMAVIIMIIFAFSVLQFYAVPTHEAQSVEELKERGKSALTALDDSENLRDWIAFNDGDDDDNLKAALIEMLPSDVGFNLTVFRYDTGSNTFIFEDYVNFGSSPSDKPIATINYVIHSEIDDIRHLRFQLWYI